MKTFATFLSLLFIGGTVLKGEQISFSSSPACRPDIMSCSAENVDTCCSPKYGVVVLALQWLEDAGPKDGFTLHGLWPDKCDGHYPPFQGCDHTRAYNNVEEILRNNTELYEKMKRYWPSYTGDLNKFWSHEWVKHGTCVTTLEPRCYGSDYQKYQEVQDFFSQALALRDKFDMYATLAKAGIVPGRRYRAVDMHSAIMDYLDADAELICVRGQLREIRLYFKVRGTDGYQVIDSLRSGNCGGYVDYPEKY
ncbi:uncharacterized protein VTP21DRAFT_7184 [Calcarisporiella thermophila]|uniref:uncharacterized protein n=1 Tax=Calcarisporiella thermophila TaxID=911321 RepID=UPI0037430510